MARNRIANLKQLHTALRSLSIAEFMRLSPHGRAAYGALFDELAEEDEPELALPAPEPPRSLLPRTRPPSNPPPVASVFPPGEGFKRVQPVANAADIGAWVRAATGLGLSQDLAEDALTGRREMWVRGRTRESMEQVGFTFDPGEASRVANVTEDVYLG